MDKQSIKEAFEKTATVFKDGASTVISGAAKLFKSAVEKLKEKFGKDKDTGEDLNGTDKKIDTKTLVNDLKAVDKGTEYDSVMERAMLSGINSMNRHPEMDQKQRANLASAVSAYTITYGIDSARTSYTGTGASEQEKGIMRNIASEYGLSEEDLRAEVSAVREETDKCMELIEKAGDNGISADDLEKHPGLKTLISYNGEEKFKKGDFDADKFVESDAGKEWLNNYAATDSMAACQDDQRRVDALVKAVVPAVTGSVVNAEIELAKERGAEADQNAPFIGPSPDPADYAKG